MTGRDSKLRYFRRLRASAGLAALAGLACVGLVSAQPAPPAPAGAPSRPPATGPQTPPAPVAPPPTNGPPVDPGVPNDLVGPAVEEAPPAVVAPPPPLIAPPPVAEPEPEPEAPAPKAEETAKKAPEPAPLRRPRENVAIFQALDKITAETLRFQVQIGRPVRYKNLVFTVRACERTASDEAMEDSVAYVVVESQPKTAPGKPTPPARQAFRGWMYASSPGLHPLEHPVYDAWLITCRAS